MEKKKLEDIDLIIIRGLQAAEREVAAVLAKYQQDRDAAFRHIADKHGIDLSLIGVDYGFDLDSGYIVPLEKPSQPSANASATGIDPRAKKGRKSV